MLSESKKLKYSLQGRISNSQFSEVHLAIQLKKNKKVIIKRVIFQKLGQNREILKDLIKQEIFSWKKIQNLNVTDYIDDFEDKYSCYFVEEYCNCQNLESLLKRKVRLQEQEAIGIIRQVLNGLQGLHQARVTYRDLRLHKILLQDNSQVKLSGFAITDLLSKTSDQIEQNSNYFDTKASEEVEKQKCGLQADVFSVGYIFYCLLFGKPPFPTNSRDEYLQARKEEKIDFQSIEISSSCQELLKQMLKSDPMERITFPLIYNHPFFQYTSWSNIGLNSYQIQASSIDVNNSLLFYKNNSSEIDEYIRSETEQLTEYLKKLKIISQAQSQPELDSQSQSQSQSQQQSQQQESSESQQQSQPQQQNQFQPLLINNQNEIQEQINDDLIQQNDQTYKKLNRILYFSNTISEFNQLNLKGTNGIQIFLSLKVQMELQKIYQSIFNNNNNNNQNQNEYQQLITILENLILASEYQIDGFKEQFKQPMLNVINKITSSQDLDKYLLDVGIAYILDLKKNPLRVHKHLIECIRNRDLDKATFEPNLYLEFEFADIKKKVEIQNELNALFIEQ